MPNSPKITPFLWFDDQAEAAAKFYVSLFPNSRILATTKYGEGAPRPADLVMTVVFELDGRHFTALNGGPEFHFTEAVSFAIDCEDQAEIDRLWDALTADGGEPGQCGWLKDRFGLSWQVVPKQLPELLSGPDKAASERVMAALLKMTKLDLPALQAAHAGK